MVVGLHTTALWTTGTVSLGSRGRCFFTAVVVVELERAGVVVRVVLRRVAGLMVVGAVVVKETMLRGMAIED